MIVSSSNYKLILDAHEPNLSVIHIEKPEALTSLDGKTANPSLPGPYYCLSLTHGQINLGSLASCCAQLPKIKWDLLYFHVKLGMLAHEKSSELALKILSKEVANLETANQAVEEAIRQRSEPIVLPGTMIASDTFYIRRYGYDRPLFDTAYSSAPSEGNCETADLKGIVPGLVNGGTRNRISHTHSTKLPDDKARLKEMLTRVKQDIQYFKKLHGQISLTPTTEMAVQQLGREIAEDETLRYEIKHELSKYKYAS